MTLRARVTRAVYVETAKNDPVADFSDGDGSIARDLLLASGIRGAAGRGGEWQHKT